MDWYAESEFWKSRYKILKRNNIISSIACVVGGIAIGQHYHRDECKPIQDKVIHRNELIDDSTSSEIIKLEYAKENGTSIEAQSPKRETNGNLWCKTLNGIQPL